MRQILTNFTAGEVTPKLDGRVDIAKYFNSVKTLFNMIVYPYGGVTRRAGTKFVYPTKNGASRSRLIPFRFSTNYMMEFGDKYIRFFEAGGAPISITGSGGPAGFEAYYVFQSDFSTGISGWGDYSESSPTHAHIDWSSTAASTMLLDDDCTDMTGWTDNDFGGAVSEVSPAGQFRFDTNAVAGDSAQRTIGTAPTPTKFTMEIRAYFAALGTFANFDWAVIYYGTALWRLSLIFASDGLFIMDNAGAYNEASVNLVKCNATADWQTFRFEVDRTISDASATVKVWVNGVNEATCNCGLMAGGYENAFSYGQLGSSTPDRVSYLDHIKIAEGCGPIATIPGLALWSDNAATLARAVREIDIPAGGNFFCSIRNSSATPIHYRISSTLWSDDIVGVTTLNAATSTTINFNTASITAANQHKIYLVLRAANSGTVIIDQVNISRYAASLYEIPTTINEASLSNLRSAQREDTTFMVSSQREMPPAELIRYDHADWTFGDITFDHNPFNGATTVGYPACVSFFEQRSLWGNTLGNPQGLWGSVTGVYRSLEIGLDDDDGFAFNLDSEDYCPIYWIAPTKQLVVGTGGGLFKISSDAYTEPITPTNIFSRRAERTAAADMLPCTVGVSVLFMEEHNRMLGQAKYDAADDGIAVTDMAILSEHLLNSYMNGSTIVELAYQKTPDNILWGRQENGNLLGFTYNPKQDVFGWHHHETEGSVESIAVIPGRNYDELWMIVNRQISGSASRIIEVMQSPEFENVQTCWFLDSAVWYDGAGATTITGLDHLNGATVKILADGAVVDPMYVTGGSIILTTAASKVLVGRSFTSRFQSMRAEVQTTQGTIQGKLKYIYQIVARVFKTASFKAGYDWDHMDDVILNTVPPIMGDPIVLTTGDVEILPFRGEYEKEGHVCIEQTDPVPLSVTALVMDMKVKE